MDGIKIPTLETKRLRLRPFRRSDVDEYAALHADPEVMRYVGGVWDRGRSTRHLTFIVGHWCLWDSGMWAVELKDGRFIGTMGFSEPEGWPGCELAWYLARQYWGFGYATEGARAALACAFSEWRKDRIISLIVPENLLSIRVADRLGMRVTGKSNVLIREAGRSHLVYGIDRATYLHEVVQVGDMAPSRAAVTLPLVDFACEDDRHQCYPPPHGPPPHPPHPRPGPARDHPRDRRGGPRGRHPGGALHRLPPAHLGQPGHSGERRSFGTAGSGAVALPSGSGGRSALYPYGRGAGRHAVPRQGGAHRHVAGNFPSSTARWGSAPGRGSTSGSTGGTGAGATCWFMSGGRQGARPSRSLHEPDASRPAIDGRLLDTDSSRSVFDLSRWLTDASRKLTDWSRLLTD